MQELIKLKVLKTEIYGKLWDLLQNTNHQSFCWSTQSELLTERTKVDKH